MAIPVIQAKVEVGLPLKTISDIRSLAEDGLAEHSDEEILKALAEDILERYFHTEYFDTEAIVNSLQ